MDSGTLRRRGQTRQSFRREIERMLEIQRDTRFFRRQEGERDLRGINLLAAQAGPEYAVDQLFDGVCVGQGRRASEAYEARVYFFGGNACRGISRYRCRFHQSVVYCPASG